MATESERTIVSGIGVCIALLIGIYGLLAAQSCSRDKWRGFVWPERGVPAVSFTVGEYPSESECVAANERAIQAARLSANAHSVCKRNCKPLAFTVTDKVCEGD